VGGIDVKEIDVSKDFTTADKYDIQSTPTTIVLDRSGQIVQSFVGLPSQSNLMAAMETAKSR
jgi:protein-disulfide isomerase